jgi:hypothetical protein
MLFDPFHVGQLQLFDRSRDVELITDRMACSRGPLGLLLLFWPLSGSESTCKVKSCLPEVAT